MSMNHSIAMFILNSIRIVNRLLLQYEISKVTRTHELIEPIYVQCKMFEANMN